MNNLLGWTSPNPVQHFLPLIKKKKSFEPLSLSCGQFSSNPNRLMDSIGLQAQPPKFNGSTSHLGAAACICSSIFTGSIQKCTLKPRKMSLIAISSSPQQLTPKCSCKDFDLCFFTGLVWLRGKKTVAETFQHFFSSSKQTHIYMSHSWLPIL